MMELKIIKITSLDAPEVSLYERLNEKQVKKVFEPNGGAFICESVRVIERALTAGYEPISFFAEAGCENNISYLIRGKDIPVFIADHDVMKEITGYSLTGGVLAAMRRRALPDLQIFLSVHNNVVVLDDVENPTNVGAIFRSAAALRADGIVLTQGSADPLYRRAARVSMGTVFQIDWTYADGDLMSLFKKEGYTTIALALSDDAVFLNECKVENGRKAIIMGNEDHGISNEIIKRCDLTVKIPMNRDVDSLNVAAASAVAFWEIFKK